MERITSLLSGRSLNDSVLHQTPFEKSLRRRLHKVGSVLELIETENEYTPASALSSADELRRLMNTYERLDAELARVITQYIDVSLVRKRLFKGEEMSIKHVAYVIKTTAAKGRVAKDGYSKEVKDIYAAISVQNPLAPPFDLARPHFEKDLDTFNLSYQVLLDNFKHLVARVGPSNEFAGISPYSTATLQALVAQAENLTREIAVIVQKIFVVYEERLLVFEEIKESCHAICKRSRFVLGSHHAVYKELIALKHAIM
ncbi:uncharacterized protein (UPF0335 family) [Dyadobacter sp. BE34]|uniref:Uncharacterized protein (UPF0335 family) n=1 Tax=Dyadobacter fermentans TaxID=94254 RepID=A0ABU1R552_9BACT|nr:MULTISPECIES: hypothetical protein [Dyadobacter]MDR6808478.1 uncharacterized protein (UPF0335 family) [Dyadobacter fermentans]MDR7046221.1 uncharacterized protein (UPF0335 family) [Dyadobacter sp. BE242]MDR7200534.1 uncharacterized protein (UPF0335 family) [Dyadobacter sp. BE34]MDR7218494.1 uncharacterized protein (UPF0335 family) [Dyadobacter sp. BE31]MDR7266424.1 uncharacterized protein (UPF0335 family) [Dyadobacter sp. BE32]